MATSITTVRGRPQQDHAAPRPDAALRQPDAALPHQQGAALAPQDDAPPLAIRLGAEALGAFALTFVAAGADTAARISGGAVDNVARAVAPGLLVMAFIYAMGDRSGAHLNPAVTLSFTFRRLFPPSLVPGYVVAQLTGAIGAALVLRLMFGTAGEAGVTAPHLVEPATAVAIEAVLTMILVLVILGTTDRARIVGPNAALAVGATIALCGLIALPLEGASMNPARSTGPAVVFADVGNLWIYWVGPAIGATLAVLLDRALHGPAVADRKTIKAARGTEEGRHS